MNNLTQRPALGHVAAIGSFYNERTDTFLPSSLLKKELHPGIVSKSLVASGKKPNVHISYTDTYEERFDKLGIESKFRGSILASIEESGATGMYLREFREKSTDLYATIYHEMVTCEEKLNFANDKLQGCLQSTDIDSTDATHVVTGIRWGVVSVIVAKCPVLDTPIRSLVNSDFHGVVSSFKSAVEDIPNRAGVSSDDLRLEVTAYSDHLLSDGSGILILNLQEAFNFIDLLPLQIKNVNQGLGYPIAYTMLPVTMLPVILSVEIAHIAPVDLVSPDCLRKLAQLCDLFRDSRQKLLDYHLFASGKSKYLPRNHVDNIADSVQKLGEAESAFRAKFASTLRDVRAAIADPEALWLLHRDFSNTDQSPHEFTSIMTEHQDKLVFIEDMVAKGMVYIGYSNLSIEGELSRKGAVDSYFFRFSKTAMEDTVSWEANQNIFEELSKGRKKGTRLAIVDCDATASGLEKSNILHFHKGQLETSDILKQREFLVDKCLIKYKKHSLDARETMKKPLKRSFVKIACPGIHCDPTVLCDWLCSHCFQPVEYGHSDDFIYCDCGRASYKSYDFKCKNESHGPGYESSHDKGLLKSLKKLDQSDYLNILILGETGVGKSTFINAFVNYLTFDTLDEAMQEEKLTWVIPSSFDAMDMDRSTPGSKIKRTKIAVGSRPDEVDGSTGASATQQTTVYPITSGTTTIRLIDTPGIGDTRGLDYDRKNVADIIATLGNYDDLHGVLILLKSNNARLTPTFSFCVKELLRNLHRDAAANMAFGFTNTRISNYTPGDTLGPLESLLEEHPDVGLSTATETMYCFDSESFRFLAAYKNGFNMPNEEDFRRSWKHSRDETFRLLAHFQSRKPHAIKSTTSLHGTRELISMLTIPMADISQNIRSNIALCEDNVEELRVTRATGDELRKKLIVEKIYLDLQELGHHRTVCRHTSCFEVRRNDNGDNFHIYRKPCHEHCHLNQIVPDTFSQPGLVSCAAFGGRQACIVCNHGWELHMHIIKETIEKRMIVNDGGVEKQLADHADIVQAKQQAIFDLRLRIVEYKDEHDQIQKTAAQFSNFLKREAIALYNDKTQAYIEFLINEEEAKVFAGKSNQKLRALREDLKNYLEEVAILEKKVGTDSNFPALTPSDIDQLVRGLYRLKHFGNNLKSLKTKNVTIHEGQNREISHRVRSSTSWGRNTIRDLVGHESQTYLGTPRPLAEPRRTTRPYHNSKSSQPQQHQTDPTSSPAASVNSDSGPSTQAGNNFIEVIKRGWRNM